MAKNQKSIDTVIVATPAVVTLINAAGKAAGTMYSKTLEAAKLASAELNGAKPMAERISEVVTRYADTFKALKTNANNVRSIFVDALTLHACAGDQVTIVGADKSQQTLSASAAVATLAKNPMREAAKQVRETHDMGRKTKPKEVIIKPAIDTAGLQRETLAEVADHMASPDFVAKLVALMDVAGYILQAKAKLANQAPAKPAKPAKLVTMASLPVHRVTGAVNLPAPL
jgi:hypothetical protein